MENDYAGQIDNQNNVDKIDEEKNINYIKSQKSNNNFASKRPVQNAVETLDIEPLDEKNLVKEKKKSEDFEIDDPW